MPNQKKTRPIERPLCDEVGPLARESAVAEATAEVFSRWERALASLDAQSRQLLEQYFDGTSIAELSRRSGLSRREVAIWIARSKRTLIHGLRQGCPVRQ